MSGETESRIGTLYFNRLFEMTGHKLNRLPDDLDKLTELSALFLSNNDFDTFPLVITEQSKITYIEMANNRLEYIPPEIGALESLAYCNLKNNKLTILPKEIGALSRLTSFDLSKNHLTSLPDEFANLKGSINIDSNYLCSNSPVIESWIAQWRPATVQLCKTPVRYKRLAGTVNRNYNIRKFDLLGRGAEKVQMSNKCMIPAINGIYISSGDRNQKRELVVR
jgi:Leucine-rich repeat (LRR) protein